jgi:hypothetical protein
MTNALLAKRLAYSERTFKNVLQELTMRLGLRNRTQAIAYAVRNGWISRVEKRNAQRRGRRSWVRCPLPGRLAPLFLGSVS